MRIASRSTPPETLETTSRSHVFCSILRDAYCWEAEICAPVYRIETKLADEASKQSHRANAELSDELSCLSQSNYGSVCGGGKSDTTVQKYDINVIPGERPTERKLTGMMLQEKKKNTRWISVVNFTVTLMKNINET